MDCEATVATHVPEEHEKEGAGCYPRRSILLAVVAIGLGIFATLAYPIDADSLRRLDDSLLRGPNKTGQVGRTSSPSAGFVRAS